MDFEVTIQLRTDGSGFYPESTFDDIKEIIEEEILNALYELDDYKIKSVTAEEM